jgi:2-polyprenyl-3-methyl-5-hydroxy-6-metoxy-1,4-benzoquinol methylase
MPWTNLTTLMPYNYKTALYPMKSLPRNYYHTARAEIVPLLPESYGTVLEVGCGEGAFASYLREGIELWGCELNPKAAEAAASHFHKILVGKFSDVLHGIPDRYFDLVICNDVIEHMEDHDSFLDSIQFKMKPGAILVGSVPNVRHIRNLYNLIVKKDWHYQECATLDRTHLRWFTEKSLRRTFNEHNLELLQFIGINGTRNRLFKFVLHLFNAVTLGQHRDIEHLQFAFQIRKSHDLFN